MARRRSQAPFYGLVCKDCLEANPLNTKLLNTQGCSPSHKSSRVEDLIHVQVAINDNGMLERIRPFPKKLPPGKGFILCKNADGLCQRGPTCAFAHSRAEQKAWNAQLDYGEIETVNTPTSAVSGSLHTQAMLPKRRPSHLKRQVSPQQQLASRLKCQVSPHQESQGRDNPRSRSESRSHSESSAHSESVGGDYKVSTPTTPKQQRAVEAQRQVPSHNIKNRPATGFPQQVLPRPHPVTHSGSTSLPPNPKYVQPHLHPPTSESSPNVPLSTKNYKSKFTELLKLEEIEHKKVLEEKCNGEYDLFLYQYGTKPPALRRPPDVQYRRYGYLENISGDQVAYATQASQGSIYILNLNQVNICKADILRDNYSHTEEKLYIGFEAQEEQKIQREMGNVQMRVVVKFMLKHSYFQNLKSCVSKAAVPIIQKIVPTPRTFSQEPVDIRITLTPFKSFCSPDQFAALESILTCSPRGPPNIIVGPFCSGKTRLLAIAASCFFTEARVKQQPARILVCTQQQESVDNFYDHYQNLMIGKEDDVEVIILSDSVLKHNDTEENNVYRTIQSFLLDQKCLSVQQNYLVMSTCMMVRELVKDLGDRFFTHILIDEGAQMREPEAIAPLSLANPDTTKIVIAGDQHQVGPAMLFFGEVPSLCGHTTSLLERLHFSYKRLRQESYISTLVTNYRRSHPDIFELPSSLFYDTPLISPSDRDPPSLHPLYPYPLVFVCSNIHVDQLVTQVDDNVNEVEAGILLDEVNNFAIAKSWPTASWGPQDKVMSQTCIMSTSRPQLTMINQLIPKKRLSGKLKTVRRLPTYDVQDREFRALFLSTSEQTNSDASSRNPTQSFCNPHVFNTSVNRVQSLVVAIGNPFLLLRTEKIMLEKYGKKAEVWSNYLKRCLEHKSFFIPPSLDVTKKKAKAIQLLLEDALEDALDDTLDDEAVPDGTSNKAASMLNDGDSPRQAVPSQDDVKRSSSSISTQSSSGTTSKVASRLDDYEVKHPPIGRGGFGVVFHVKNTTDKGEYALKIIRLSDNPKKQDKVLREVRNLARLEHTHIVRYYTSWKERAPDEWAKKELWSMLKSSDSLPTALIPVTTARGSTSTTSSSPHTTNTSTSAHVVSAGLSRGAYGLTSTTSSSTHTSTSAHLSSADLSQGAYGLTSHTTDSVVSFRADSSSGHSQIQILETAKIQPSLPLDSPPVCLFIQTELCQRDTLRTWLNKNLEKSRTRSHVLSFFKQILKALVYIHGEGFVHRDLKPSNIFFSRGGEERLKIGDFGLARTVTMPHGAPTGVDTANHGSADSYSKGSMQAGTLLYMSPEQMKGEKCDEKSDMFALGIILFELYYIMEARLQVLSALHNLKFPPKFEDNFLNVTKIVKLLLAANPAERPTADKLTKNTFLQELAKETGVVPVL